MKRRPTNQNNQFSQDRNLQLESLENRNLMTVANVVASAAIEFATPKEESVTIGHEKNITSLSNEQCQGACYLNGPGKDRVKLSNGFFAQTGSASELGSFNLSEVFVPAVKESVAILGTANGIDQARNATYEDYWDMDMSIRHKGQDNFFNQLGSVPRIEYRSALEIYNGFVVPEMPTAEMPLRDALEIYNGF